MHAYSVREHTVIQDIFITKPQDPDQRVVMAVLRQKVDQLWIYQPDKNREEHFLHSGYLAPYRHHGSQITHFKARCLPEPDHLCFSN